MTQCAHRLYNACYW